jgi:hypothetical protein
MEMLILYGMLLEISLTPAASTSVGALELCARAENEMITAINLALFGVDSYRHSTGVPARALSLLNRVEFSVKTLL